MTFADQASADLPTFLSVGEFGQLRVIDGGSPVACVLTKEKLDDARERGIEFPEVGVFTRLDKLHVRLSDLAALPVVGQRMVVAGVPGNVRRVDEAQGMLCIYLEMSDS